MIRRFFYLVLLLLGSCISGADDNIRTYACYYHDTPARDVEIVIKLDPERPKIANLYGGKKLVTQIKGKTAYEVYRRDQQWSTSQFFDVLEFDGKHLVHSYVYFMSPDEYADGYGRQDLAAYSFKEEYYNPHLFALVPETPHHQNSIKVGWNKTRWHCKEIPEALFIPYKVLEIFYSLARV